MGLFAHVCAFLLITNWQCKSIHAFAFDHFFPTVECKALQKYLRKNSVNKKLRFESQKG